MKIKKNQVLMTEGVLPYMNEDGSVSYKLKKWDNIRGFVGQMAYITDEHPPNKTIETSTKLYGNVPIQVCPMNKKALCGDINLDDNAPSKYGYSAGYSYVEIDESGEYEGQHYDKVQLIKRIDHIALTDYPRNTETVATDSVGKIFSDIIIKAATDSDSTAVVKYSFAYDSVRPFEFESSNEKIEEDENMTPDPLKDANKTITALNKQIAVFEATQTANDSYKAEMEKQNKAIDSLKAEKEEIKIAYDGLKEILELQQKQKMKSAIDSLIKAGVKKEALDGKNWMYIQGRLDQLSENKKKKISSNVTITNLKEGDANPKSLEFHNLNDYTWSNEKDEWVFRPGVN